LAGFSKIPAYIRTANDQQMLEMALIENIQRENLNAIEIALSYHRLLSEFQLKQEELGDRVGKNRTTVNNYLRLLKLPDVIQAAVRDSEISMGHARALINIDNHETQILISLQFCKIDCCIVGMLPDRNINPPHHITKALGFPRFCVRFVYPWLTFLVTTGFVLIRNGSGSTVRNLHDTNSH
jgi:hypothetical protein